MHSERIVHISRFHFLKNGYDQDIMFRVSPAYQHARLCVARRIRWPEYAKEAIFSDHVKSRLD